MKWSPGALNSDSSSISDYEIARTRMVNEQMIRRGITNETVLKAMRVIPRHLFIDQAFLPRAYSDHPLPIGYDQTISQPYIVALMTSELELNGDERVLEIGTGSGYQSAILAVIGCTVFTIERIPELSKKAGEIIKKLGFKKVFFKTGDGSLGWKEKSPFDRIIVTAGAPAVPEVLLDQLAFKGKIVIPVGDKINQQLLIITKNEKTIEKRFVAGCNFVPLVGKLGWSDE
jgi:protein-L-isoaspartate(D-aspartate) O-methyltransferase